MTMDTSLKIGVLAEELITEMEDEGEEPKFDFNRKEDIFIHVLTNETPLEPLVAPFDWKDHFIHHYDLMTTFDDGIYGMASYEHQYSGFLDYAIDGMIGCPGEGYFVVVGFEGHFRTDYWGEVDAEYDYELVRRATPEEIEQYCR